MGSDMLLADIKAFCGTHDLSIWQFGEKAMNDKSFVNDVEGGRRVWPETEAKVRRFMATYKPVDARDAA